MRTDSARRPATESRRARPSNDWAHEGSTATAALTRAACSADSDPARTAASTSGCDPSRDDTSSTSWALALEHPDRRASHSAASRAPSRRH
jgi:hypothetical protein